MKNGKPSWLTYLATTGVIVVLVLNFTKISDRIVSKGTGTALLAQVVKNNTDAIKENSENHETEIEAVKEDIQQIKLDLNTIQSDLGYTKEDIADIRLDQKEILRLLYEIKNN